MGKVIVSSVADPARLLFKHGMTRTFRDAFVPLITDFKRMKMSRDQLRHLGIAVDATTHMRTQELVGLFNEARRGTAFERGLEYGTSRMGIWSLFDHWNQSLKQLAGSASIARTFDDIEYVLKLRDEFAASKGGKVTADGASLPLDDVEWQNFARYNKRLQRAQDYLARGGINEQIARAIWKEVNSAGGGNRISGSMLPNVESWANAKIHLPDGTTTTPAAALRAHLMQDVNNTIITPGVDKRFSVKAGWLRTPTPFTRMIFQFKSFALASTSRTRDGRYPTTRRPPFYSQWWHLLLWARFRIIFGPRQWAVNIGIAR